MNGRSREWPANRLSEAEVFLLRAAGLRAADPALAAWRSYREIVPEGAEEIGDRRLLPLVCRNLLRLGHEKDPYLAREYARSFGANSRLLGQAVPVLRSLHVASIPTMVLKGTALLVAHYRDEGVRPMSDVDILVPSNRVETAFAVLEAAGCRGSHTWFETESHAGTLVTPEGLTVDLHRHATYEARFDAADASFFAASIPLEILGVPTSVMGPGDQLLHTVIHGLRWSIARSPIWLIDAAVVLRGGRVDLQQAVDRSAKLRLTAGFRQGLELLRSNLGSEEPLDSLLGELSRTPSSASERVEHAFRVREPRGAVGALPNLWFAYRRSDSPDASFLGFAAFLRRVWGLKRGQSLARVLAQKTWRRIRALTAA